VSTYLVLFFYSTCLAGNLLKNSILMSVDFRKFSHLTPDSEKRIVCIDKLLQIRSIRSAKREFPLMSYDLEALNVAELYYRTELRMINNRSASANQLHLFN